MKTILFVALLAGASAAQAAPVSVAAPVAFSQTTPTQEPMKMSKSEMKKMKKARKQNGPEVYKGTVAEQRRIVTDAAGSEKEDGEMSKKEQRKNKKN
jgi:Skp family chaperone for outer membrane proteins